ncbi:hypothetical protein [Streptomyces regalis]|uniref:Uncharacterized protein n=1 Tax=Streptomyces regalis TaxID=68262 RepID=A0A101JAK7_9ACTN|nr:hypothetical protein [Streptomyces regalis]KUL23256.1 hypothetical protein ADL12_39975 [Streptomyces regalis]
MQTWFQGKSQFAKGAIVAGVFTVAASVVAGVFQVVAAFIPVIWGDNKDDAQSTPSASVSSEASPPEGKNPSPQPEATPSQSPSSTAPASYQLVYDQSISLGLDSDDWTVVDFDAPSTRRYSDAEWEALKVDAEETGTPMEPDLSYQNDIWGYVKLRDGRNAAELKKEDAPATGEECARHAQVGGFSEAQLWGADGPPQLPVGTVLCIVTDKGNIVRAEITRHVGTDPGDPPRQIEFKATMWSTA